MMRKLFYVDGKPFFAFGGQSRNCSGYNTSEMKQFWKAFEMLGGNTAEVPIAWEVIEKEEGTYDFTVIDELIAGAEARKAKLILLWFATWKNGVMKFAPAWVKQDRKRFQRVISPDGVELSVLSSHCKENYEADCKAFCAVMEHIHRVDQNHTVLAMQIENEPGIFGRTHRDHGADAEAEFAAEVPADIVEKMKMSPSSKPYAIWQENGGKMSGNWRALFGEHAAELFSAWSIAKYIDGIACEGKKRHNIPMFVNVWLDQQGWERPGEDYPSGSPIERTFDLWKWTTTSLDTIAPDNYKEASSRYLRHCAFYSRENNPLLIPESPSWDPSNAYNMLYAIGNYQAAG
ncbi:MAG: beta-galactosidase, partial [Lachnospiraceae bacterium]|nr:beta-galactosidase [Lachnospiraceae bacterium]